MTLADDGYIDLAYTSPDHRGLAIGAQLYKVIEAEARRLVVKRLYADASHPARCFFEHQGWKVVREQTVTRNGVALTNFAMEKHLV